MHKLTVCYPGGDGTTFDMDYYRTTHKDLCFSSFPGLQRLEIDEGINGPYIAMAHLYFESMEALQTGLGGPNAGQAAADVANFTNSKPVTQISEVVE
jgi:uncharacterized protein (TIGR02118 family)